MRVPTVAVPPLIDQYVRPYVHWGYLRRVIDGDTIAVDERITYGIVVPNVLLRLVGIQAPELRGPERFQAAAAADHLADLIGEAPIAWHTAHDRLDRYGRYIARVHVWDQYPPLDLSIAMIKSGHARHFLVPRTTTRLANIIYCLDDPAAVAACDDRGV